MDEKELSLVYYLNAYQRCLKTSATLFIKRLRKPHKKWISHLFNISCQKKGYFKNDYKTILLKERFNYEAKILSNQSFYLLLIPSEKRIIAQNIIIL